MIKKQDAERIIKERQRKLDELSRPEVWERYTRHMECGEEREFKQDCIDDEIIIEALKPYTSHKPKTNFDKIKTMSVEEMADFLLEVHSNGWVMGANDDLEDPLYNKEWLESEVTE